MHRYPSPLEPNRVVLAHDLLYVVPCVVAVLSVVGIAAAGGSPRAWVIAGSCWLFVALTWSQWARRASVYWTTPFRDGEDRDDAEALVVAVRDAPGLASLAPDVWAALSEASVLDEREGREPNHGHFRKVAEEFQMTVAAAHRNAERTGGLERTIELMREVRLELEERDPS